MSGFTTAYDILRDTFEAWSEDKAPRLGAALAYYSVFSLAPLLVIAIAIAGFVFGTKAAEHEVVTTFDGFVGKAGAEALSDMLQRANQPNEGGLLATFLGIGTLLVGASGVFGQLKDALNTVWGVAPKPGGSIWGTVRERFFSITMVLGTGFLLLTSLLVTTFITAMTMWFSQRLPGFDWAWRIVDVGVALALTTGLFALIFKYLPDAKVAWKDVFMGAALTAVLFGIGKFALGYYLGSGGVSSPYGAAGALVIILLWVYWTSQILLFGAEFTKIWANRYGSHIRPNQNSVILSEAERVQQGIPSQANGISEQLQPDRPQFPAGAGPNPPQRPSS